MMSDEELDKEELQAELGQIKEAMGLHERYPWFTRMWLVWGVFGGIIFALLNVQYRYDDPGNVPIVGDLVYPIALVVVFAVGAWAEQRWALQEDINQQATPTPDWNAWLWPVIAGTVAIAVGFASLLDEAAPSLFPLVFFSLIAVGYVFMGQLLNAYHIRKADCYAFASGGGWLLALVAVIPYVPTLRKWSLATLGIGMGVHHVGAYIYLSRT